MKTLRKKLFDVVILLSWAFPATVSAAPRWLQRGPLGMGLRSIKVMALPWTNPKLAMAHYLVLAGTGADFASTQYILTRCHSCAEEMPWFGTPHPSPRRMVAIGIPMSIFTEHAVVQGLYEHDHAAGWVAAGGWAGLHGWATEHNTTIKWHHD